MESVYRCKVGVELCLNRVRFLLTTVYCSKVSEVHSLNWGLLVLHCYIELHLCKFGVGCCLLLIMQFTGAKFL